MASVSSKVFRSAASHRSAADAHAAHDEPPAWVAFGAGLTVLAGMIVAALWIAEAFEILGFAA